jgi:hypothetical protein
MKPAQSSSVLRFIVVFVLPAELGAGVDDAVALLHAEAITDGKTEEEKQYDAKDALNGSNDP